MTMMAFTSNNSCVSIYISWYWCDNKYHHMLDGPFLFSINLPDRDLSHVLNNPITFRLVLLRSGSMRWMKSQHACQDATSHQPLTSWILFWMLKAGQGLIENSSGSWRPPGGSVLTLYFDSLWTAAQRLLAKISAQANTGALHRTKKAGTMGLKIWSL